MKKILFFLLLFINLHIVILDEGLQFLVGTAASAQHMYKEAGDNCQMGGLWYEVSNPAFECDSIKKENFQCLFCGTWFDSEMELTQHEASCKKSPGNTYYCQICRAQFTSEDERNTHQNTCSSDPTSSFRCDKCGKAFRARSERDLHASKCNGSSCDLYYCTRCHSYFTGKYSFETHYCYCPNRRN